MQFPKIVTYNKDTKATVFTFLFIFLYYRNGVYGVDMLEFMGFFTFSFITGMQSKELIVLECMGPTMG